MPVTVTATMAASVTVNSDSTFVLQDVPLLQLLLIGTAAKEARQLRGHLRLVRDDRCALHIPALMHT